MSTLTEKLLSDLNVNATGDTTVYTVPASTRAVMRSFVLRVKGAGTVAFIVKVTNGANTREVEAFSVPTKGWTDRLEGGRVYVLEAADVLKINCDVAGDVDVVLMGAEIT